MTAEAAPTLKHRIAECFSKAAPHYDDHAGLQRDVANVLLNALPVGQAPRHLVDVGCGTGYVTRGLRERYPGALVTGVDPALGMLETAARRHGHDRLCWQLGDAEYLPFEGASLDMVVSSLAIQWCPSPAGFLQEAERTLRPGGWLAFTTLLDGSLAELKTALATLDDCPRGNAFITPEALSAQLQASRLTERTLNCTDYRVFHDSGVESLRALKAVGAATPDRPSRHGLMSRRRWACMTQTLERFRRPEGLPTTYRVAFVVMQKPDGFSHDGSIP
ncbi:malonyl-ACP O-methyltransferase BioC [Kushneria sp. Sum13]|uniref:malonyl-ACP O-methyltransferase BioC n=1 Tax=Kushneria sp. Sum13 TaxID=3459196 RepID=UPI00404541BD